MSESNASSSFNAEKAEAFAGRLLRALNDAAFCLMASIGHRTGLFDAMRDQPPLMSKRRKASPGDIVARRGRNQ
jgi:hypothetical protein